MTTAERIETLGFEEFDASRINYRPQPTHTKAKDAQVGDLSPRRDGASVYYETITAVEHLKTVTRISYAYRAPISYKSNEQIMLLPRPPRYHVTYADMWLEVNDCYTLEAAAVRMAEYVRHVYRLPTQPIILWRDKSCFGLEDDINLITVTSR